MDIESSLKGILERRKLEDEPRGGKYSWVCILKSGDDDGKDLYRFLHTGRLANYEKKRELVAVIKGLGSEGSFLLKVIKRIFKSKAVCSSRTSVYQLEDEDLTWLQKLIVCDCKLLENEVVSSVKWNTIAQLRKEGLCPARAPR